MARLFLGEGNRVRDRYVPFVTVGYCAIIALILCVLKRAPVTLKVGIWLVAAIVITTAINRIQRPLRKPDTEHLV
jgi:hypothetical protein